MLLLPEALAPKTDSKSTWSPPTDCWGGAGGVEYPSTRRGEQEAAVTAVHLVLLIWKLMIVGLCIGLFTVYTSVPYQQQRELKIMAFSTTTVNSKLTFCYVGMAAWSTLPLNRPATVEGSEGKGAWCERCWATDTGPQKESDATGSRKEDKEEKEREQEEEREQIKRLFKARPRRKWQ